MKFNENIEHKPLIKIGHLEIGANAPKTLVNLSDVPVIPTRNLVLFPGVSIPISLVRDNSRVVAELAKERNMAVAIICQTNSEQNDPSLDDLYKYGVLADVLDVITLPDNSRTAIVLARGKVKVTGSGDGMSMPEAEISASVKEIKEVAPKADDKEFSTICSEIKTTSEEMAGKLASSPNSVEFMLNMQIRPDDNVEMINTIATHIPFDIQKKMELLSLFRIKERGYKLYEELVHHQEMMSIAESVHQRARETFDDQQRRMFLQRQMEAIDQELNGDDNEITNLRERAKAANLPEKVAKHVEKEIGKLERLNAQSPDYSVQYTYLETLLDLPWQTESELNCDFDVAKGALDKNHFGLEKIKDRILEQIAVLMHNPKGNAPILCLVGPPGVGKTSLGQSVADALGRKFQRVSFGGLHDEAEIRGHRRTYIGAMPGRIIDAIKRAGTSNPVLLLDEIDKIGQDYKGDPSSALLEVLDPEQNCKFHDNYVDVDFDLSKVLFIATANTLNGVSQPLIDRMEVIDLSGYLLEEKIEIARRHLIPRQLRELNLDSSDINISDSALVKIIEGYTGESGVRQLEKAIASIGRKVVLRKVSGKVVDDLIDADNLKDYLGIEKYSKEKYEGNEFAGVVTGLAWTAVGGEILFIESSLTAGKEQKLTLTGNLGDVMKESAMIALQYVRAHADKIGVDPALFEKYNLHIHVPEGAIPKDGPSAGITMATSIASAFTQRRVREKLAMTGEITLRGKVMPVGGIKEKMLAAKRAGIVDIILSEENRKDVEDIEAKYREGLKFHYVSTVGQVFELALADELAADARSL